MRSWFTRWFARRSHQWKLSELQSWADMGMGAGPTAAGIVVTPERALSVPAVYACISVLAQDIGKTPTKLRRRIGADAFVDATDHDLWELLHALPNPETSAYSFKHQMIFDLLTSEHAYAEVVRVDGRVSALWRLDAARMTVDRDDARRKRYRYTDEHGRLHTWTFDPSRPPIFELSHPSPLRHCRDLIGTAIALQRYVGSFFGNGARPGGLLLTEADLDDEQQRAIRDNFGAWHGGADKAHRVGVLAGGLKYQTVAEPNDKSQLNETLQTIATQIAAAFRLPPWKMGITEKTSYSNLEQSAIDYATGTLDPYFVLWEHAIRRDLLTTRQYGQFDVTFDRSTLIRSDVKSLHEALARGRDAGYFSANDIRRQLGQNPIPASEGGDLYLANGNLVPLTEAGRSQAGTY